MGLYVKKFSLSITIRVDRDVTRYERMRGRRCMSIDGDLGLSVVGPSGWRKPRSEKDLGEVEISV